MRILYLVPVLHNPADLGSISENVQRKGIGLVGLERWKKHLETIDGFWNVVQGFQFKATRELKIYQDGFVGEGEKSNKIVQELAKKGSRNYQVVKSLLEKGAVLMKTEDLDLAKKEAMLVSRLAGSKNIFSKTINYLAYTLNKNSLLQKRDAFIAKNINETLGKGEKGVLFLGAYHDVAPKLAKDIKIIPLKDRGLVLEYQQNYYLKAKEKRIKELEEYLASPVKVWSKP